MMKSKNNFNNFESFVSVAFPPEKLFIDPFISNFYRPLSTRISWALINIRITPNFITFLQIIVAIFACTLIGNTNTKLYFFIGIILLHFAYILDCVDGEIARAKKMASLNGVFLDKFAHFVTMPAIIMSVSLYYSRSIDSYKSYLLIIAFIASFATFNPVHLLITSLTQNLVTKKNFNQYNFDKYKIKQNIFNQSSSILEGDLIDKQNKFNSMLIRLKLFAKQFFRHVTYLACISFLFFLEIVGMPNNLLITFWSFLLIAIILKECIFLFFVFKGNIIEKRYISFKKCLNSFD